MDHSGRSCNLSDYGTQQKSYRASTLIEGSHRWCYPCTKSVIKDANVTGGSGGGAVNETEVSGAGGSGGSGYFLSTMSKSREICRRV